MLIHNAFFLIKYTTQLNERLKNYTLSHCLSTSKTDLVFLFENKIGNIEQLNFQFIDGQVMYKISKIDDFGRLKGLQQFEPIVGKIVKEISHNGVDRSFKIVFDKLVLIVKAYGRYSNILLFNEKGSVDSSFINIHKKDEKLTLIDFIQAEKLPSKIDRSTIVDIKKAYPFFPKSAVQYLTINGFENLNEESKSKFLTKVILQLNKSTYFLDKENSSLSYFNKNELDNYDNPIDAANKFYSLYASNYYYTFNKKQLLSTATNTLKKSKSALGKVLKRLDSIKIATSNKDKADLLMANMWQIKKGEKEVILKDFYTGKPVKINLNTKLNAQQNAEKYYKKSKNEHQEISLLIQKEKKLKIQIENAIQQIQAVEKADTNEQLRPFLKEKKKQLKEKKPVLPYYLFNVDGYQIWVGKNAKSNDAIIKIANKNDLWFHARLIAGSHVILRNKNQEAIPKKTIEKAASLAAYYSKAKGQTMVPVIKTYLKYVRKPKNALPGQVLVEKEEVLLVEPKKEFLT